MGKRPVSESRDGRDNNGRGREDRYQRRQTNQWVGGDHGQRNWAPAQGQRRGQHHRGGRHEREEKVEDREEGQVSDVVRPMKEAHVEFWPNQEEVFSASRARKALFQSEPVEAREEHHGKEAHGGAEIALKLPLETLKEPMVEKDILTSAVEDMVDIPNGIEGIDGVAVEVTEENNQLDPVIILPTGDNVEREDQVMGVEAMESGEEEIAVRVLARKKVGKGIHVLQAVSSKKRLVQTLLSPRKRGGSKSNVKFGDGLYPAKPRKDPGNKGDQLPPKPDNN